MFRKKHVTKRPLFGAARIAVILTVGAGVSAQAAEIRCACAEAIRPILAELGPRFEQTMGHKLLINYGLGPVVVKRIQGGDEFDVAIINPPQVGILAIGAVKERPVVVNGGLHIRTTAFVTVSADHRIVDGREAVQFLVHIKQVLEDPAWMLVGG